MEGSNPPDNDPDPPESIEMDLSAPAEHHRKRLRTDASDVSDGVPNQTAAKTPPTLVTPTPTRYPVDMTGPCYVLVESTQGALHRLTLAHELVKFNISFSDLVERGKNRVRVTCRSGKEANNIIGHPQLANLRLKAYAPRSALTCQGVIHGLPNSYQESDVIETIMSPHALVSIKIFTRPGDFQKSATLTFNGTSLPESVFICQLKYKVKKYIPRVIVCHQCARFGHIASQCRSKSRCLNCGGAHLKNECDASVSYCIHCKGNHQANDRRCPKYQMQQTLRKLAVNQNVSLREARQNNHISVPSRNINGAKEKSEIVSTVSPSKSSKPNTTAEWIRTRANTRVFSRVSPELFPPEINLDSFPELPKSQPEPIWTQVQRTSKPKTSTGKKTLAKDARSTEPLPSTSAGEQKSSFSQVTAKPQGRKSNERYETSQSNRISQGKRDPFGNWDIIIREIARFIFTRLLTVTEENYRNIIEKPLETFLSSPLFICLKSSLSNEVKLL